MAAEPKTGHLRVWTADEIGSKSSVQLEIILEDIKDEIRSTQEDDEVYLVATKAIRHLWLKAALLFYRPLALLLLRYC
jgi:hypothetical protein